MSLFVKKLREFEYNLNNPIFGKIIDLSKFEIRNVSQMHLIKRLIDRSSMLEELHLPTIKRDKKRYLFMLNNTLDGNSTLRKIHFPFNRDDLTKTEQESLEKIKLKCLNNAKQLIGIHGGGNIGLGFAAEIANSSHFPYRILATTSDMFLSHIVNAANRYSIKHEDGSTTAISNIRLIDSRVNENIIRLYAHANIMFICLTERGFTSQAEDAAKGLLMRFNSSLGRLKIFVLMNKPDSDRFIKYHLTKKLLKETHNLKLTQEIINQLDVYQTMVDRVIYKISRREVFSQFKKQIGAPRKRAMHEFMRLKELVNEKPFYFNLFRAERKSVLYVSKAAKESYQFPLIQQVDNLARWISIKQKLINGPHAILAWTGGLLGYEKIAEALDDPLIRAFIKKLIANEIKPILLEEHPTIKRKELNAIEAEFMERCKKNSDDLIIRVGRDPLRKLNKGGCIRSLLEFSQQNELPHSTSRIKKGMAAGFLYALKGIDPENIECRMIRKLYSQKKSLKEILCLQAENKFSGLDPVRDQSLLKNVMQNALALEFNIAYSKPHLVLN